MKSDSRVSIRRRRQPAPAPLSIQKGVMSNGRRYTRRRRHDGVAATACQAATMVGPVRSGDEAPDRTLLSFQRPLPRGEGLPAQPDAVSGATSQYICPAGASGKSRGRTDVERSVAGARYVRRLQLAGAGAPLADLQHPPVELVGGQVERPGVDQLAVDASRRPGRSGAAPRSTSEPELAPPAAPAGAPSPSAGGRSRASGISPSSLHARPGSAGAAPRCVLISKCSAISAGRWTSPSAPGSTRTVGISSGASRRTWTRSKRSSAAAAASPSPEALDEPPRELALRLDGVPPGLAPRPAAAVSNRPIAVVGNAHQLAEHLLRRVGDADVVAQRLAHPLHAVGPGQDRHRQDRLRRHRRARSGRRARTAG